MPHLTDLAGNPMTWEELLRRNAEWHDAHDRQVTVPPPVPCFRCRRRKHGECTGRARVDGIDVLCECAENWHKKGEA